MKTIYSSLIALLVMLVVSQTASAIPTLATEADFSLLNTPSITNEYTGSRWHATFKSIRDFIERKTAGDVIIEAPLMSVDDSLRFDPIPFDPIPMITVGDDEEDSVGVPEPALVALIALGLVGIGFVRRKKNH